MIHTCACHAAVQGRTIPSWVIHDCAEASCRVGPQRQVPRAARVEAGVEVVVLLHILPDRVPGDLPGTELREALHDEGPLALADACGVGDDLGVLPVQEVAEIADRGGQHTLALGISQGDAGPMKPRYALWPRMSSLFLPLASAQERAGSRSSRSCGRIRSPRLNGHRSGVVVVRGFRGVGCSSGQGELQGSRHVPVDSGAATTLVIQFMQVRQEPGAALLPLFRWVPPSLLRVPST